MTVPTTSRGWRALILAAFLAVLPSAGSVIQLETFDTSGLKPTILGPSTDALLSHAKPAAASNNMVGAGGGAAVPGFGDSMPATPVEDDTQYLASFGYSQEADDDEEAFEIPLFHPEYLTFLPLIRGRKEIEIKENWDVTIAYAKLRLAAFLESVPPVTTLALATLATGLAVFLVGPALRRARARR